MVNEPRSPALDRSHLARQTFGEDDLAREVLGLFLTQSNTLLAVIAGAPGAGERRDAAHTLTGAARAIGAFEVAARAEAVEAMLTSPCDRIGHEVAVLTAAVEEAKAVIEGLLGQSGDGRAKTW